MRTLVDLLNDDCGYVRIFVEESGFGYERSAHGHTPWRDLFDRMSGYDSMDSVRAAAQLQLLARHGARRQAIRSRRARA